MSRRVIPVGILPIALGVAAGMAIMAAALNLFGPDPIPQYSRVKVDSGSLVQKEPDAKVTFPEKITRPVVKPKQVARADSAARNNVASFCRAAGWAAPGTALPVPAEPVTTADPVVVAPAAQPSLPPPVMLGPRSGVITRRSLDFRSVISDGSLERSFYRVRLPATFRADGDSLLVQSSRFGLLRELAPAAPCAVGGVLAGETGSSLFALAGCGLTAYLLAR